MARATFLLGVGAQKAGTTWLHHHLSRQPFADFGMLKEYHLFDSLTVERFGGFRRGLVRQARGQIRRHRGALKPADRPKLWAQLAFQADPQLFFDYMAARTNDANGVTLTGDITPSYSALETDTLDWIRSEVLGRGMKPRVLFLMRDPVARAWSAVRFHRRRLRESDPEMAFSESEDAQLLREHDQPAMTLRGSYDVTLRRLQEVFAPAEIHVGLYEELFRQSTIDRLCDWLDVPRFTPDFRTRRNASPGQETLSCSTEARVAEHYAPAIEAARAVFGRERLDALWPSTQYLQDEPFPYRVQSAAG